MTGVVRRPGVLGAIGHRRRGVGFVGKDACRRWGSGTRLLARCRLAEVGVRTDLVIRQPFGNREEFSELSKSRGQASPFASTRVRETGSAARWTAVVRSGEERSGEGVGVGDFRGDGRELEYGVLRQWREAALPVEHQGVDNVSLLPVLFREGWPVLKDLAHVGETDLLARGELWWTVSKRFSRQRWNEWVCLPWLPPQ